MVGSPLWELARESEFEPVLAFGVKEVGLSAHSEEALVLVLGPIVARIVE